MQNKSKIKKLNCQPKSKKPENLLLPDYMVAKLQIVAKNLRPKKSYRTPKNHG